MILLDPHPPVLCRNHIARWSPMWRGWRWCFSSSASTSLSLPIFCFLFWPGSRGCISDVLRCGVFYFVAQKYIFIIIYLLNVLSLLLREDVCISVSAFSTGAPWCITECSLLFEDLEIGAIWRDCVGSRNLRVFVKVSLINFKYQNWFYLNFYFQVLVSCRTTCNVIRRWDRAWRNVLTLETTFLGQMYR